MITNSWHSYPKIYNLGHRAISEMFLDEVIVEEKVDGSQFSFGVFEHEGDMVVKCRSKGAQLNVLAPEKMFTAGVNAVMEMKDRLKVGWTYRGEYLSSPKHNTLAYDRIPKHHVIIFDINTGEEKYLTRDEKEAECERIGLEIVPIVHVGMVETAEQFREFLDRESILGGQKIEGVVAKNYSRFGIDGKVLMAKFVSEAFKEIHGSDWKERNPNNGDIIQSLIERYRTPARWAKAVQHMKEAGKIENNPRDLAMLFPEVGRDIKEECEDAIKTALFAWAWPQINRGTTAGLAEWYKDELIKVQFEGKQ